MSGMNKMNMALDDIINQDRRNKKLLHVQKSNNQGGQGGNFNGNNRNNRNERGNDEKNFRRRNINYRRRLDGIDVVNFNRRGRRGNTRGRIRRDDNGPRNFRRYNNFDNMDNNVNKPGRLRDRINRRRNFRESRDSNNPQDSRRNTKTRLFVSHIHKDVINSELKSIFSRVGPLKRCGIHWDAIGNSKCTADVEFENPEHARTAVEEYNNALIDGVQMKVAYNRNNGGGVNRRIFRKRLGGRQNDRGQEERRNINRGPNNRGPNNRGPNNRGPNNRGPNNRGPNNRGPNNRGPNDRRPDDRGLNSNRGRQRDNNSNGNNGNRN